MNTLELKFREFYNSINKLNNKRSENKRNLYFPKTNNNTKKNIDYFKNSKNIYIIKKETVNTKSQDNIKNITREFDIVNKKSQDNIKNITREFDVVNKDWEYDINNITSSFDIVNKNLECDMKDITPEFLCWFIGFFEGDGFFGNSGEAKITQSSTDTQVLYKIQETLGFGEVKVNCKVSHTHCWYVRDYISAGKLALIFNDNLVTSTKLKQFHKFMHYWGVHRGNGIFLDIIGKDFLLQEKIAPELISFNNGWLSGFIDADGCWCISISKTPSKRNPAASVRMMVAAQGESEWVDNAIKYLKIGRRDPISHVINLKWTVGKSKEIDILIDYINKFPHKTKKSLSFEKFCEARRRILLRHHYGDGYLEMKDLCSSINPKNIF